MRGDIAPSSYRLMKINGPGQMDLSAFSASTFLFVEKAIAMMSDSHYDIELVKKLDHIYVPERDLTTEEKLRAEKSFFKTPDSIKCQSVICDMVRAHLVEFISKDDENYPKVPVVIMRVFAVVKELKTATQTGLARPIENGNPVNNESSEQRQKFSLAGATQLLELLLSLDSEGMTAFHFDFCNYYFQLRNSRPDQHHFRVGDRLFRWLVVTMGWYKATFIAQALTLHMTLDGISCELLLPEHLSTLPSPPGIVRLKSGAAIVCIYDSVIIFDKVSTLKVHRTRVLANARAAHALLKYERIQPFGEAFVWCGFEFICRPSGVSWRVNPDTIANWNLVLESSLDATPRSLWRILGVLNFIFVILELPKRLLGPGRNMQGEIGLIQKEEWDSEDSRIYKIFPWAIQIFGKIKNDFRHRRTRKIPRTVLRFATDATLLRWGWYQLNEEGDIINEDGGDFPFVASIDVCEAYSAAQAIGKADELDSEAMLLLAGDNIPQMLAFDKGTSTAPLLYAEIVRAKVDTNPRVMVLIDVTTLENVADIKSRPDEIFSDEEIKLRKQLTSARTAAGLRAWLLCGSTFFSRTSSRSEEEISNVEDQVPPTDDMNEE